MQPTTGPSNSFVRVFLFLCFSSLFFWFGLFSITTVLPLHMQALGYSERVAGWVMGLSALSALGAQLTLGGLVDRFGPRSSLVGAGLLLLLSTLAGSVGLGVAGLVLLNLMQGLAVTLLLNAGLAAASAAAPPAKRGTAVAWYGLANNLSGLIAAPLAIPLLTHRGFGAVQVVVSICGLAAGLLGALVTVRPEAAGGGGRRRGRIVLASAVRPALVGAAVAVASGGFVLIGPLRAQALGLANPGLYLTVQAATLVLSRVAFGPLSDRRGRGWAIVPGLLCLAAGFCVMGLVSDPRWALVAPGLIGVGLAGSSAGLIAWTVDRAGPAERGRAINTYYLFWELALFLGMTAVGYLASTAAIWAYGGVSLVVIVGLLVYLGSTSAKVGRGSKSEVV